MAESSKSSSIDGGGIRGIIPATVLAEIEDTNAASHRRAVRPDRRDVDRRHPRARAGQAVRQDEPSGRSSRLRPGRTCT